LNDAVIVRQTFPVSRERLFRAWSEPKELMDWFSPDGYDNPSVEADVRPGGRFRIAMRKLPGGEPFYVRGEYRVVDFPARLVFTWTWEDPVENVSDSIVTVDLIDRGGSTEVVLTHERLPEDRRVSHEQGWLQILNKLGTQTQSEVGGKP
jgi:uncharacterized protein YndB with AHSA1/START domain